MTAPDGERTPEGAPTAGEAENRAGLAAAFPPDLFPAQRSELVEAAAGSAADDWFLAALGRIPDRRYGTVGEVWDALQAVSPAPGEE